MRAKKTYVFIGIIVEDKEGMAMAPQEDSTFD